ncbi:MAG: hypothetical protein II737_01845 [Mailhella sp.]|nr:hypothetical protein [Mailhella sp.]
MNSFPCNTIIVADLASRTVERLDAGALGLSRPADLAERFPDDLILRCGALTGSFAPAACLLTVQSGGGECLLRGHCGPALRRCGADALVLRGSSPMPCALVLHDKGAFFLPMDGASDVPGAQQVLGRACGRLEPVFEPVFIIAGPAAFAGHPLAAASLNVGIAPRTGILARDMAGRGLAALALAGSAPLPPSLPVDDPLRAAVPPALVTASGLKAILKAASPAAEPGRLPAPGRSIACYGCPTPCGTWIKTGSGASVPCTSPEGLALLSAAGADAARIADVFALACRWGLDPAGLSSLAAGPMPEDPLKAEDAALPAEAPSPHAALASELGVCPFFLARHSAAAQAFEACLPGTTA